MYYGHEGPVASPTTIPLPHGPAGHSPIQFPTCPSLPQSPFAAGLQDRLSQQIWLWVQVRELTSVDRWRVTKEDIYVNLWSLHTHTCPHVNMYTGIHITHTEIKRWHGSQLALDLSAAILCDVPGARHCLEAGDIDAAAYSCSLRLKFMAGERTMKVMTDRKTGSEINRGMG